MNKVILGELLQHGDALISICKHKQEKNWDDANGKTLSCMAHISRLELHNGKVVNTQKLFQNMYHISFDSTVTIRLTITF